jgi:hypothetical protein
MATTNGTAAIDACVSGIAGPRARRKALCLLLPVILLTGAWIEGGGSPAIPTPAAGVATHPGSGYYLADPCSGCH